MIIILHHYYHRCCSLHLSQHILTKGPAFVLRFFIIAVVQHLFFFYREKRIIIMSMSFGNLFQWFSQFFMTECRLLSKQLPTFRFGLMNWAFKHLQVTITYNNLLGQPSSCACKERLRTSVSLLWFSSLFLCILKLKTSLLCGHFPQKTLVSAYVDSVIPAQSLCRDTQKQTARSQELLKARVLAWLAAQLSGLAGRLFPHLCLIYG